MENDLEDSDLSRCFICYLCGDFFRRPRILPCGHTFCSECLGRLKDEIINQGKQEIHHSTSYSNARSFQRSLSMKTLSTENLPENGNSTSTSIKWHDEVCNGSSNDTKESMTHVRKESSSCVDDVDSMMMVLSKSCPSSGQWSFHSNSNSNSASPINSNSSSSKHEQTSSSGSKRLNQHQTQREASPMKTDKRKTPTKERSPSMVLSGPSATTTTVHAASRPCCSQCGSFVSSAPSQQDSSATCKSSLPTSSTTTTSSARDKSPSWAKDSLPKWDSSSPRRSASHSNSQPPACSFEHKHVGEMELFVCPIPECNYSMRVMNLARWSPKNKVLTSVMTAWRRWQSNRQDSSTQTDITTNQSVLVTIPRSFVDGASSSSSGLVPLGRRKRHSSMIDIAMNQTVSMDGVQQPGYQPRGHYTWKSYAAVVGMNILQQILNL